MRPPPGSMPRQCMTMKRAQAFSISAAAGGGPDDGAGAAGVTAAVAGAAGVIVIGAAGWAGLAVGVGVAVVLTAGAFGAVADGGGTGLDAGAGAGDAACTGAAVGLAAGSAGFAVAAGAGAGAGAGAAAAGAGGGSVALTTVLQAGLRLATFFCRQVRASLPPGDTPEHFDMKSERQLARMALCCSGVICAMAAVPASVRAAILESTITCVKTGRMMFAPVDGRRAAERRAQPSPQLCGGLRHAVTWKELGAKCRRRG